MIPKEEEEEKKKKRFPVKGPLSALSAGLLSAGAVASLKEMPARQSTRLVLFAFIQVRIRARSGALLCAETVRPPAHHRWRMPRHAHWSRSRTK